MSDSIKWRLDGRIALITGGGTGIGKAIALRFAEAGARIVVSGKKPGPLEAVAAQVGGRAIRADITREPDVAAMFAEILGAYHRLDILINNAGVPGPILSLAEMDAAQWDECIAVNIRGAMLCMKYAAQTMAEQRSGAIVNMSSLMGLQGYPLRAAYSAAKFALIGMTQAAARELGSSGVRVNALCPGAVSGEMTDRMVERRAAAEGKPAMQIIRENYIEVAALRRWVSPEDVAEAALFLAGDAASSTTGETLRVDAGRL